jgi:hypothetical protein
MPKPTTAPTAADVVGLPFLPPGRVAVGANRGRALVGRLHAAMGPPPVRILEGIFGMLDHRVLVELCRIGVPDALIRPTEMGALAVNVGADPERLERLVRFAATRGWVRIDRRGRVRATRVTAFLRSDHPGGWRAWVDFAGGDEVVRAVAALSADPATTDGFAAVNGLPFFPWMAEHPERGATFDRAMAAGGRMHALVLAAALDLDGVHSVCDVGGGTGDLLAALLDLVPGITGTVLDRAEVVARAVTHDRLTALGGDAFVEVPAGFDLFLVVNVLHDWNDTDARTILERVAAAASPGGARIVVVDSERRAVPQADIAVCTDVLMAALTDGGQERSPAEFAALGRSCGLELHRSIPLASGDLAHEFSVAGR